MSFLRGLLKRISRAVHHGSAVWLILGVSNLLTLAAWWISNQYVQTRASDRFAYRSDEIGVAIQRKMQEYEQVIRGGTGFFSATGNVTRDEWRTYVDSLRLNEFYPGIQGLGFSKIVRSDEHAAHVAQLHAEGLSKYDVNPRSERSEYTAIVLVEPFYGANLRALGFDMFSEPVRRAAMESARDTGRATVSGIVHQGNDQDVRHGFLMYSPIYEKNMRLATVDDRRAALVGYVFSEFAVKDLMREISGSRPAGMEFEVFDTNPGDDDQLFSSTDGGYASAKTVAFQRIEPIEMAGRKWMLRTWTSSAGLSTLETMTPFFIAVGGLFINLLFFAMIKSISSQRRIARDLAHEFACELEEERERFALVVEASPDGVWDWNLVTGTVYFSPRWKSLLGYDDDELPNSIEAWFDLIHPEDRERASDFLDGQIQGDGQLTDVELRFTHKDGSIRWILGRGSVLRDENGKPNRMLGTHSDITERKNAELGLIQAKDAAQAAAKAKAAFLATMSHEIRTPMNGVIGVTKLLLDFPLGVKEREYVETIRFSAESLLIVINDVLDFSKIDSGKLEIENSEFHLKDEIAGMIKAFAVAATSKSLDLATDIADLDFKIKGDNYRLRQILNNLIGNAIKFTDSGLVKISSEVTKETDGEVKIKFCVMDSGIGLSPETIQRIFEEFSQADSSMSRRYGGSGLGLTISKRLIELMGGRIHVESRIGIGSTFWFELPFEKGSRIESKIGSDLERTSSCPVAAAKDLEGLRVLVAEDNRVNQVVITAILEKFGCKVEMAANGVEVLWAVDNQEFDLILMDCQMPEMDGFETTSAIRMNPASRIASIPIIALTANALKGDSETCLLSGMNGYVSKPVDESTLLFEMKRFVGEGEVDSSAASEQSA